MPLALVEHMDMPPIIIGIDDIATKMNIRRNANCPMSLSLSSLLPYVVSCYELYCRKGTKFFLKYCAHAPPFYAY